MESSSAGAAFIHLQERPGLISRGRRESDPLLPDEFPNLFPQLNTGNELSLAFAFVTASLSQSLTSRGGSFPGEVFPEGNSN